MIRNISKKLILKIGIRKCNRYILFTRENELMIVYIRHLLHLFHYLEFTDSISAIYKTIILWIFIINAIAIEFLEYKLQNAFSCFCF